MQPISCPYKDKNQPAVPDDALSIELIPDAVVTVDQSGTIRRVNGQLIAMFGYEQEEVLGQPIEILLPESARQRHVHHRKDYQLEPVGRPMGAGLDLYGRRKDGREFPIDVMLSSLSMQGLVLAVIRDISASKKMSEDLKLIVYSDPLTNLSNRAALYQDLKELFKPNQMTSIKPMSIALFDLDGFKQVNETLGHSAGDQLLKVVAQRWTAVLDKSSCIYRVGGDEFVILIQDCGDPCRVAKLADAILMELKAPIEVSGKIVYIDASAGIAIAPADGADVEELIANVDTALYKAKAKGPGSYVFFHNSQRAEIHARRDLDLKLRRAHANGEFELYFQPQVRLTDSAVVGAEALLRWRCDGVIVAPGAFIEALAASPIAIEVGTWILRSACEIAATWRSKGLMPVRVAVNLFPNQFKDPFLIDTVQQVLADANLPPSALELEITENIALSCNAVTLALLQKLREMGVHLAFDDFGTGYASLGFLTQMPLTHIKIDQNFVRGIPNEAKATAIVRSLIVMAHNIGLQVIAEGVETVEQERFLQSESCDEGQGFLFAKPLPLPAFEELLKTTIPTGPLQHPALTRIALKA